MKTSSKLLIVVSHFNDYINLRRCIGSFEKLDKSFIGIIVVDDCSDEEYYSKIQNHCNLNSIKLIRNVINSGVSSVRNIGINFALENNYSHITFIDCDDHLIDIIDHNDYSHSDVTIYDSVETKSKYKIYHEYKSHVIKLNINNNISIEEILIKYAIAPNKVPTLTSCWAKIYDLNIILNNKLLSYLQPKRSNLK